MLLKAARFAGLTLMGAQVGVSYSHALQAPEKKRLPADTFLWVHNVLMRRYAAGVAALETGAMLSTLAAASLGRGERRGLMASNLAAFACSAGMFEVWAKFIEPINREVRGWTPATMPENWEEKRERWHSLHSVRLVLALVGMAALVADALNEAHPSGAGIRVKKG